MHLIINNQAPLALGKQPQVRELAVLLGPVRQHLVGRECHWPDVLGIAGILGDLMLLHICFFQQLAMPLAHRGAVGGQNQRRLADQCHGSQPDHSFAGTRRQHHHA
jgi:hypothetical protein